MTYQYLLQNTKTHKVYSSKFGIRVLDLTQIDTKDPIKDFPELNYWAKFFVAETWEEVQILSEKSDGIRSAVVTLKELTADEKIKLQCEAREKYDRDLASALRCGEQQGAFQKAQNIAIKLLQKGNSLSDIAEITELTEDEIAALR